MACGLTLLGSLAPRSTGGKDLPLPTRNDRLLLAYLALSAGPASGARPSGVTAPKLRHAMACDNLWRPCDRRSGRSGFIRSVPIEIA